MHYCKREKYAFAPRWMSKKIAAYYTCVSVRQVEKWIAEERFPIVRVDGRGRIRIDKIDLDNFMSDHKEDVSLPESINKILEE